MQLDFQQFLIKLEKLTDIRPIPDKEFVETYIKAYYLTENDMERWIKEHRVRGGSVCALCHVLFLSGVLCNSESCGNYEEEALLRWLSPYSHWLYDGLPCHILPLDPRITT